MPKKKEKSEKKPANKKSSKKHKHPKAVKCCSNCQDYENCSEKGNCCEYCDYYWKGYCTYELTKDLLNRTVELTDYRGDDYGIDDYSEYASEYG